jgi:hypothetical protein
VARTLAALPPELVEAAHLPMGARAVVLALLCDAGVEVRAAQLARVSAAGDPPLAAELARLLPAVLALPAEARLPLLDLTLPALRLLSQEQYAAFRRLVDALVGADRRVSLFEYALHRVLVRHLEPAFAPRPAPRVSYYALRHLGEPVAVLLSSLAHAGAAGDADAAPAFAAGAAMLGAQAPPSLALLPRDACTFRRLDDALATLAAVAPARLGELVAACGATVAHDGRLCGAEGELLRAIADALGCPLPPLVAATAA